MERPGTFYFNRLDIYIISLDIYLINNGHKNNIHIRTFAILVGAPLVGARNQWTRGGHEARPDLLGDIICVYKS